MNRSHATLRRRLGITRRAISKWWTVAGTDLLVWTFSEDLMTWTIPSSYCIVFGAIVKTSSCCETRKDRLLGSALSQTTDSNINECYPFSALQWTHLQLISFAIAHVVVLVILLLKKPLRGAIVVLLVVLLLKKPLREAIASESTVQYASCFRPDHSLSRSSSPPSRGRRGNFHSRGLSRKKGIGI